MDGELINLRYGEVYRNKGGGEFRCTTPDLPGYELGVERLQNVKTGWTFRAHGIREYPDGTIEWDYSSGGYFDERFIRNAKMA